MKSLIAVSYKCIVHRLFNSYICIYGNNLSVDLHDTTATWEVEVQEPR